jgi:hypothetical protein
LSELCVHLRLVAASSTPSPKPSGHRRKLSDASACANMATGEGSDKGEAERGRAVTFRDRRGWREQRGGAEEEQREERPHWETAAVAAASGGGGAGVEWEVGVRADGVEKKRKGGVVGEGRARNGMPACNPTPPTKMLLFLFALPCRAHPQLPPFFSSRWLASGRVGLAHGRAHCNSTGMRAPRRGVDGPAAHAAATHTKRVIGARAPPSSFPRDSSGATALLHYLRATTICSFGFLHRWPVHANGNTIFRRFVSLPESSYIHRSELQHKPARLPAEAAPLFHVVQASNRPCRHDRELESPCCA